MDYWIERQKRESEWLDGLKSGDEVLVDSGMGIEYSTKETVDRTTKSRIFVKQWSFRRKDGREHGKRHYWRSCRLVMVDEENREIIETAQLSREANSLYMAIVIPSTKDELKNFIAALTPYKKKGK